jgi:uncharacterized membrane protein SirB2
VQAFYTVLEQYTLEDVVAERRPLAKILFTTTKPRAPQYVMDYSAIKTIHVSAVMLSLAGFFARGLGMLAGAAWVESPVAKTLPHVVDTVLIVSAIALAWMLRLGPTNAPWIAAKIIGLLAYIALGMVALRFGRTRRMRAAAWIASLATFGYIVSVAITKDPRGFLLFVGAGA